MSTSAATHLDVPFLGLHYFDERHETLFFGRDEQLRDVLAKLASARFVTVIGSSGTGKSSLVRASVIPALGSGFLTGAGPRWRTVKIFPGSAPVRNLAVALENAFGATGIEVTLRRGRLGIVEAMGQCGLGERGNLLIVVDQFEELFRYQRVAPDRHAAAEEAAAFVQLLLEATARPDPSVCVIVTMRSDYLGACAQFRDLPERINAGLYLIPRMRRDQMGDAITGPAAVAGATFTPALVQRLLNDAGEDPDQLPVLQHALLRTWLNWKRDPSLPPQIEFRHYEQTGGVRDGLDNHAEEIYGALSDGDKKIAEVMFKALTERDPSNLDIRCPTKVCVIASIAGVSEEDVTRVANAFREEGVAFLKPPAPLELKGDTELDITHESLIRKWYRLGGTAAAASAAAKGWVQDEADARDEYRDLLKRARNARSEGDVLSGADLYAAIDWRKRLLPPEWALRYDRDEHGYATVAKHIDKSQAAHSKRLLRQRNYFVGALATLIIILVMGALALQSRREARREADLRLRAEEFRDLATARQLAAQAEAFKDRDAQPELSALLAIEALLRKPIPEASQALRWPIPLLRRPLWSKDSQKLNDADYYALDTPVASASSAALRFSPNGQHLAQLTTDSKLQVYRASDGQEIQLPAIPGTPTAIAWAGDELRVAALVPLDDGSAATALALVPGRPETRELARAPCPNGCGSTLTPDGTRHVVQYETATSDTVLGGERQSPAHRRWSLRSVQGTQVGQVEGPVRFSLRLDNRSIGEIEGDIPNPIVDLGDSSNYLAWGGRTGLIRIYEKQPRLRVAGQVALRTMPTILTLSPDGQSLAVGNANGEVRVITWATQRPRAAWSHSSPIAAIAFSADGRSIASMDNAGGLRVMPAGQPGSAPIRDWIPLKVQQGVQSGFSEFDPSGRFVVIRDPWSVAQLLDARSGASVLALGSPGAMGLSPDGRHVVWSTDQELNLMDLTSGAKVRLELVDGRHLLSLALAPDGKYLATQAASATAMGLLPGPLRVIDVQQKSLVKLPPELTTSSRPASPTFSPDGRWLAYSHRTREPQSATAVLVRAGPWTLAGTWKFNASGVMSLFSPDGRSLFLRSFGPGSNEAARTRPYLMIDTTSLEERPLDLPEGVGSSLAEFSPDGRLLAIATREQQAHALRVFDAQSGKLVVQVRLDEPPTDLAFSPGARYVGATFGASGLRVFELGAGHEVSRIGVSQTERVSALQFSEDERTVAFVSTWASAPDDSSAPSEEVGIRRQYLLSDELIREACARVTRPLTQEEWDKYLPGYAYRDSCSQLPPAPKR